MDEQQDLEPDPKVLQLLRDLEGRYGLIRASQLESTTEAARHYASHGHKLSYGCCRPDRRSPG
jgi:hypothetical protein